MAVLYEKLNRYRLPKNDSGHARINSFWKVSESQLHKAEKVMAIKIPSELRQFNFNVDKVGRWSDTYINRIVVPSRLPNLWNKTDLDFNFDKTPIAESFNQFMLRLYENITFYLDHVGVYE